MKKFKGTQMVQLYSFIVIFFLFLGCSSDTTMTKKNLPLALKTSVGAVTPSGIDVSVHSNDIVFQFQDNVVPLGSMDRKHKDIAINITPSVPCNWRWISRSTLSCKLPQKVDLKPATAYRVVVNKSVSHVDNFYIEHPYEHHFSTELPTVKHSNFVTWTAPDIPYIKLYCNTPVTRASLKKSVKFSVEDAAPIAISIIKEEQNVGQNSSYSSYTIDKNTYNDAKKEWIIAPQSNIGLNKKAKIIVESGLSSPLGPLKGKAELLKEIHTFPEFRYLGTKCYINRNTGKCDPLRRVGLQFSSPVLVSALQESLKLSPKLNNGLKDFDPWANRQDYSQLSWSHRKDATYTVWLPNQLQAFTEYSVAIDSADIKDEFSRRLKSDVNDSIVTDHRTPRLTIPYSRVVLEKEVDSAIALYATNLDDITINYTALFANKTFKKSASAIAVKELEDISYKTKIGTRALLNNRSGVMYGNISTSSIFKDYKRYLFAQVTPFAVHAKIGHFNSLIWVTDFAKANAVANAKVRLLSGYFDKIDELKELPFHGVTDSNGLVKLAGTQEIDKKLNNLGWLSRKDKRFFLKVEKNDNIALLPLDYSFEISSYGTYSSMRQYGQHSKAWGTTAQGVYKVGDKVEYKIYVRDQNNTTLIHPNKHHFSLHVFDPLSKLVYENRNFQLNEYGSSSGSFTLPKTAAVGKYEFFLEHNQTVDAKTFNYSWSPMSIVVSDFTPPPFAVNVNLNGNTFKMNDSVEITADAAMHSGGPYNNAEVRLTAHLFEKQFHSTHPLAKEFTFSADTQKKLEILNIKEQLNAKGAVTKELLLNDTDIYYGELFVEASVKDERGKYVSSNTKAAYLKLNKFVGLKERQWVYKKDDASIVDVIVVDEKGIPSAGTDITVDVEYLEEKASRVKGSGNAFVTVNSSKWIKESSCSLTSTDDLVACQFTPKHVGSYRFIATIKGRNEKLHKSTLYSWVSGYGSIVWNSTNDSTLKIIPQGSNYALGQTAKYLVKNPFPGATALVTVERYGILDSWVQTLETSTPIIELPITHKHLPGYYLSVTVISPRVAKPLGNGIVDLGKPSYKMGYVKTMVKDDYKVLELDVTADKSVYAPQDEATIKIHVNQKPLDTNATYELAVVVIDDSVLALNKMGRRYYDPYAGFNALDTLDVTNFSLISRLVGRQKFEKKGANQGGDGGESTALSNLRDDFKYVAYWNPHILADSSGDAEFTFTLPDNLTGWSAIVMAVSKDDLMGTGTAKFKTNMATEIRPIMPNQVLLGDTFSAGFNIMNRTDKTRNITVSIEAKNKNKNVATRNFILELDAYARKNIFMPVSADNDGIISFNVTAKDSNGQDRIRHDLIVNKRISLETMSNFGSTLDANISEAIQVPKNITANAGEVGALLSTSVIANVDGAFKYVKEYPYLCWEQRLTKAVAAAYYNELQEYLLDTFKWNDSTTLLQKMINDSYAFQAPNGGMAFWKGSNNYVSPYLSAYTALEFAWLKEHNYQIPYAVETKLKEYLDTILHHNSFPSYFSTSMSSTVRAVALNALSKSDAINRDDITRFYRHYKEMSLFGKAHYLQAMLNINTIEPTMKKELLDSILSTSTQSAGKIQFNETYDSGSSYLLATPMRTNCAILSTILSAEKDDDLQSKAKGIAPKIVRAITQTRGKKDHWENTQENSFCMKALADYANTYETQPVSMDVTVSYNQQEIGSATFTSKKESKALFTQLKSKDISKTTTLNINKTGEGRLYYISKISYAPSEASVQRVNSGIDVRREYTVQRNGEFKILNSPMQIKQGDIARVDLFVSLPTARHFVVVNDPVPGGLEPINSDLAISSVIDAQKGTFKAAKESWWFNFSDWSSYGRYNWSFYHKELRHDSARFYSDYLPAGNYYLSYTAQAIASGKFTVMPTHAQEMYDSDVYGKSLPSILNVTKK